MNPPLAGMVLTVHPFSLSIAAQAPTASCSIADIRTSPGVLAHSREDMTMPIDSVAPLVKNMFELFTPRTSATLARADSSSLWLSRPAAYEAEGFAICISAVSSYVLRACGLISVVAALSK